MFKTEHVQKRGSSVLLDSPKIELSLAKPVVVGLAEVLRQFGARQCFGVVGSYNFTLTDALIGCGIHFVAARHEGNAVTMADVYARMSGEPTLATVHSGPGLTNAATAIAEAAKSGTPILVLAGDVDPGSIHSNFYFEQSEFVRSLGACSERIYSVETALKDLTRAAARAVHAGETVVVSMPLGILNSVLSDRTSLPAVPPRPLRIYPDPASVKEVAYAIARAHRPLILAGHGARRAKRQLTALGDTIGALFATTLRAHGLFNHSPWNVGVSGGFASPAATDLIPESDLVLAFGASLTRWTTLEGKLFGSDAAVVQIDNQVSHLARRHPVDIAMLADAEAAASCLLDELERRSITPTSAWRSPQTRNRIVEGDDLNSAYQDTSGRDFLDPRTASKAINSILPKDRVVVTDAGHFAGWVPRYLKIPDEASWCSPLAFQSIGLGMAAAVGACKAHPDRLVVLAAGDGGFSMSLADLETAIRLKCRLCIFLYDDCGYGAEVHHFGRLGYSTQTVQFPDVDFVAVARGFGGDGTVVRTLADLEPLKRWIDQGTNGVFLVDVKVDRTLEAQWHRDAFGTHKS
jgi:thiamine pyrophosphate-dependent acetolactate synthase large subunit-like protein